MTRVKSPAAQPEGWVPSVNVTTDTTVYSLLKPLSAETIALFGVRRRPWRK